jgi:YggT family protein
LITILYEVVMYLLMLMTWALILSAIISTLLAFNVLDSRNRIVWSVADFLYRVTDPILRPIRRVLPTMSNIDFSPWVALLLIQLVIGPLVTRLYQAIIANTVQPLIY